MQLSVHYIGPRTLLSVSSQILYSLTCLLKLYLNSFPLSVFVEPAHFPHLLQVIPGLLGLVVSVLNTSKMPYPTTSIKALKDDNVPDWGQLAAMIVQKHCNGYRPISRLADNFTAGLAQIVA